MPDPLSANVILPPAQSRPDAAVQLLFLHHAGGSSYPYLQLGNQLSPAIEPFCLELAGRGSRFLEPLQADPEPTLAAIVAAVERLGLGQRKPLLLFGHSLGAELAYQLAARLLARSLPMPLGLILSARVFVDPVTVSRQPPGVPDETLTDAAILRLLQAYGGTPDEVLTDPELSRYVVGVMRNDMALLAALCRLPKPLLPIAAEVAGGDADHRVPAQQLADWGRAFAGPVGLSQFAGDHFYLFSNVQIIPWIEQQASQLAFAVPGRASLPQAAIL
ncbi:thioesterase II family protein [Chitinimonas arctica]|uniref:thioesterase II family protein n=1 Tax=Chitinimonas arctica TaxID=2594795 RepID=UPI0015D10B9E|nr:alpha/beta fold hydrolase [Chitinimonas arctica]